mmetsp:Transcript_29629/g.48413  ORF Transcript_29629/g.48413 Transcript_29629/m.48413 type:complete len:212 (-) Transcript_29629:53-688(-)
MRSLHRAPRTTWQGQSTQHPMQGRTGSCVRLRRMGSRGSARGRKRSRQSENCRGRRKRKEWSLRRRRRRRKSLTAKSNESCGPKPARAIPILGPGLRKSARKLRPERLKKRHGDLGPRRGAGGEAGWLEEEGGGGGEVELGGGQQALSSTPQSRPSDGIAGIAGVGMNGSRSSAGPTRTGNGDLMQGLSNVHLADGKWGRKWDEESICDHS